MAQGLQDHCTSSDLPIQSDSLISQRLKPKILLPKFPTSPQKLISSISTGHQVPLFSQHLHQYLEMTKPHSTHSDVDFANTQPLPFDVYHSFKFMPEGLEDSVEQKDIVKASPLKGGRFDTVIVLTGDAAKSVSLAGETLNLPFGFLGLTVLLPTGTCIGHVRILLHLPSKIKLMGSHKFHSPVHRRRTTLAYIEWYNAPVLTPTDQKVHNMASVQKAPLKNGAPPWSIIPLINIHQSCMLFPKFRDLLVGELSSLAVLDDCNSFLVNNWVSVYTYKTIYKD